jgi:tetratricopeptide (TPR) repeat protein
MNIRAICLTLVLALPAFPALAEPNSNSNSTVAYQQEISELNTTIQAEPTNVDAYVQRGFLQAKLDRYLPAISDYTSAIERDPNHVLAYNNRAVAKISIKNYRGAFDDYTQVIRLEPTKAITYNNRAIVRHQLGDCKGAIADLRTAAGLFQQQGDTKSYDRAIANLKVFYGSKKGW